MAQVEGDSVGDRSLISVFCQHRSKIKIKKKKKEKVLNTSAYPAKYQMTNFFFPFPLLVISYGIVPLIKALFKVTKKSCEAVHLLML